MVERSSLQEEEFMSRNVYYIGTNFGHSSSCCLIDYEGRVQFAIEEDRIVKEKNTSKFPNGGIKIILESFDIGNKIIWSEGWDVYSRLLKKGILHPLRYYKDKNYLRRFVNESQRFTNGLRQYSSYGSFNFVGHHRSHAYSLLPFGLPKNSLILVSDTIGENESISFFYWDGKMQLVKSIPYPHSLGSVFHQFAYHLGFKGRTAPGKLMSLSGFGQPIWLEEFDKFSTINNGDFKINLKHYPAYRLKDAPYSFINTGPKTSFKDDLILSDNNYINGKNIASSVQEWFTFSTWKLIVQTVAKIRDSAKLKIEHLGLVGGSALNCQANGYFLRNLPEINIGSLVVGPCSDDSGTSIGAAISSFIKNNPGAEIPSVSPFLGPPADFVFGQNFKLMKEIKAVAKDIIGGHIVSLFSGRMEFGPRALGGRCILGSAFLRDTVKRLNSCKSRPNFMPFAPAVLDDDYDKLFKEPGSRNMTWTVRVKEEWPDKIPSAVHITNESRVLLVTPDNSLLYLLLKEIKANSGLGIVLLTSLNKSNETIPINYNDAKAISKELGLYGVLSDLGWERLYENQDENSANIFS